MEDLDNVDCFFEKVVRNLGFQISGQNVEQMVDSELPSHMDYVCLATLEKVHHLCSEFAVYSLFHDKVFEDFLSWLFLCHWVFDGGEDAGQARHDVWVRRYTSEDKKDCHQDLCFISRRDITITDRTNCHYSQVARSDIAGRYGLIVNSQGRDPANLIFLSWEKGDYREDTADYMD